jgi:hypothetical protein
MPIIGPEERSARLAMQASEEALEALKQSAKKTGKITDERTILNEIIESYEDLTDMVRAVYGATGELSAEDALPSVVQRYIRGDWHAEDQVGSNLRLAEVLGTFYGLAYQEGVGTEESTELCDFDITFNVDVDPHSRWESGYVVSLKLTLK